MEAQPMAIITGNKNDNHLIGTPQADTIDGKGGDDILESLGGNDVVNGGKGKDVIEGGAGADGMSGGDGKDTVSYASSNAGVTVTLSPLGDIAVANGGHATGDSGSEFENITGSAFGDFLTGNDFANVLKGLGGGDTLAGNGGNDVLKGGAGDDFLEGGTGADKLVGGAGFDAITYVNSASGVRVKLGKNGKETTGKGGDAQNDKIKKIENITGSAFDDVLKGNNLANGLVGLDGNDLIKGGKGADVIDGGNDIDTLSYAGSGNGVTVILGAGGTFSVGVGGHAEGDGIEQIENLIGSGKADTLIGNDLDNVIEGGKGADMLDGDTGSDTVSYAGSKNGVTVTLGLGGDLTIGAGGHAQGDMISRFEHVIGSKGDDTLTGNDLANVIQGAGGKDVIEGGDAADDLHGGGGKDTLSYAGSNAGVDVTLDAIGNIGAANGGHATGDTGTGFENIAGSAFNDTLTGNNAANVLSGGAGDDELHGGGGNDKLRGGDDEDVLEGGPGKDFLNGGDGIDIVSYENSGAKVIIDLGNNGAKTTGQGGEAQGDTLKNVEGIIGTNFNDVLKGNNFRSFLSGGDGDDILKGRGGLDNLRGGAGADTLNGGADGDNADYITSPSAVTVTLGADGAETIGQGGDAQGDKIKNIESLRGSNFNDVLTGNNLDNTLTGGIGDDTLNGEGGDDFLSGGIGVDTMNGGDGDDDIFGLDGDDTLIGGDGEDQLFGEADNDTVSGGNDGDDMFGGDGNDMMDGGAGEDFLNGGSGDDMLTGGADNDIFTFSIGFGHDTITDFAAGPGAGDVLEFNAAIFPNFAALLAATADDGLGNAVITADANNDITLVDVLKADLDQDDFTIFFV
jgi:Ca2+-binding RTX toxin-like protein